MCHITNMTWFNDMSEKHNGWCLYTFLCLGSTYSQACDWSDFEVQTCDWSDLNRFWKLFNFCSNFTNHMLEVSDWSDFELQAFDWSDLIFFQFLFKSDQSHAWSIQLVRFWSLKIDNLSDLEEFFSLSISVQIWPITWLKLKIWPTRCLRIISISDSMSVKSTTKCLYLSVQLIVSKQYSWSISCRNM